MEPIKNPGKAPGNAARIAFVLPVFLCIAWAFSAPPGAGPATSADDIAAPPDTSVLRVAFLGNWINPGEMPLPSTTTLWEAALGAGGPAGTPGMVQILRNGALILQVNLAHEASRQSTLEGLGVRDGDVVYQGFPPGPPNRWEQVRGGLNLTVQVLAIVGSALSTYLTYTVLQDQGKI
jgi:hypothetical protein